MIIEIFLALYYIMSQTCFHQKDLMHFGLIATYLSLWSLCLLLIHFYSHLLLFACFYPALSLLMSQSSLVLIFTKYRIKSLIKVLLPNQVLLSLATLSKILAQTYIFALYRFLSKFLFFQGQLCNEQQLHSHHILFQIHKY